MLRLRSDKNPTVFKRIRRWLSNPDNLGTIQVVLVCNTVLTSLMFYVTQLIYGPEYNPFVFPQHHHRQMAAQAAAQQESYQQEDTVDTTFGQEFDVNGSA